MQRTTRQEYDFWTGLVTRSSDVDNGVSTATTSDALGRPTLVAEADGVKVETRYLTDAATHLSYRLVSNPYRAARSSDAAVESTMGWMLTASDRAGRVVRVETFAGKALPAPRGRTPAARERWSRPTTPRTG